MRSDAPAPPCTLVIFGASGDLTHRKLLPALYYLYEQKLLVVEVASDLREQVVSHPVEAAPHQLRS